MFKTSHKKNKNGFSKRLPDENTPSSESKIDEGDKNFPFYKFKLQKLLMQMERWEMHVLIESYITKLFMRYQIAMVADTDSIDEQIKENRQKKIDYETQNQMEMFDEMKQKELRKFDEKEEHLLEKKASLAVECPPLNFTAVVLKYADKEGHTFIVFQIPAEIIEKINKIRNDISSYKIQLQHEQ